MNTQLNQNIKERKLYAAIIWLGVQNQSEYSTYPLPSPLLPQKFQIPKTGLDQIFPR